MKGRTLGFVVERAQANRRDRNWHETDMLTALRDVRSQGRSGKHMLALRFSGFDPERTFARDAVATSQDTVFYNLEIYKTSTSRQDTAVPLLAATKPT
jgi:hypothetical protein